MNEDLSATEQTGQAACQCRASRVQQQCICPVIIYGLLGHSVLLMLVEDHPVLLG